MRVIACLPWPGRPARLHDWVNVCLHVCSERERWGEKTVQSSARRKTTTR